MKRLAFLIATLSLVIHSQAKATVPDDSTKNKKWKLVWSDEFNYTGLPDSTKWGYEEGFVRNNEEEYYTKKRLANIEVKDGFLTITGIKEQYPNAGYRSGSTDWRKKDQYAQYTSASINTLHKADWKYGKIVVRAKLPAGKGVWPAIWMMGANIEQVDWPACGEIDIMENVGFEPNRIHATLHYPDTVTHKHVGNGKYTDVDHLSDEFHLYTMLWDEHSIKIYIDDKLYQDFNTDVAGNGNKNCFRRNQYLLLNLALGGAWGGKIDDSILPQKYVIDYVRIYQ